MANPSRHASQAIMATCPACGLLCDDITVSAELQVSTKNGCAKSIAFFEQPLITTTPSLAGKPTDLKSAIKAVAGILHKSNQVLFAGLGTEVTGMRTLVGLAAKTGATLDHMHSDATIRNTLAMQNSGWQTTTLTEVKNRADVILAIGTDIATSYPRFFEKFVWNKDSLFNKPSPEVVYLGTGDNVESIYPNGKQASIIDAETADLPEIINALNALAND